MSVLHLDPCDKKTVLFLIPFLPLVVNNLNFEVKTQRVNQSASEQTCTCGSGENFVSCCEPFLLEKEFAKTAEQLMRSRYSAYAHGFIDYLIETTYPSQRKYYSRKAVKQWADENQWLKLEIVFSSEKIVEFKAYYKDPSAKIQIHHERSTFQFENDKWYFLEGE